MRSPFRRHINPIKLIPVIFVLAFILIWSIFLWYVGIENIIETIGVHNGYFIVFLVALFGGFSSFTSTSFYVTVATMSLAGLDPYILGILGGLGVSFGDSLFYFLGSRSRDALTNKYEKAARRLSKWIHKHPRWHLSVFIYIYSSTPFVPIDVLTVTLAAMRVNFWRVIVPVFLGNVTLAVLVALMVRHGVELF